ncbi:MAG: hypothetical protein FJ039_04285 [Chloroflexi bacterium]|nr:hypothetical protein [Chloroflexota bacterium]
MTTQSKKPYFLPSLAHLGADMHTKPFWDYCKQSELRFQRCASCGKFRHPPSYGCRHCGSNKTEWVKSKGLGTIFTFTLPYHAVLPEVAEYVPYNVIVVEFPDAPGVRLISNLIETPLEEIKIGMPVQVVWETANETVLPRFVRAKTAPAGKAKGKAPAKKR